MSDTKDLLAQSMTALDAERATAQATITDLRAQVAALQAKLDPWAAVDKTGTTDVTAQVQALIDQGLPVPAGRYLVDAVKGLVAKRDLTLSEGAVLIAKPNSAPRYCIVDTVPGVAIRGKGQIIGDRLSHTYIAGDTSEHGYGVRLREGCTLEGVTISQCTGDGIVVVGANCTIRAVVSTQNRRQGMSAFNAPGLKVYDSRFTDTGAYLTDPAAPNGPCAGVDIEPDAAATVDATFERCTFTGNRAGLLAWLRTEVGGSLNITMKDCITGGNANGIQAKALAGKIQLTVTGGTSDHNRSSAARIETGATLDISGVAVTGLSSRYALQALNGGVIRQSGMSYA